MRAARIVSVVLAGAMAVQSIAGLVLPGHYRDTGYVLGTWLGNDLVTLLLALPLLVAGLVLGGGRAADGAGVRGRLLWLGGLGYAAYNYAFYLLGATINALFPLYALAVVLGGAGLILVLVDTDPDRIRSSFAEATPVRAVGGYYVLVAASLTLVWLAIWAGHVFGGGEVPGDDPAAFRLVAALDLTLMVPALGVGGVLLWRQRPWGYVLAALAGIQGSLYLFILALNSALFIARGTAEWPGELPGWGGLWLATTVATGTLLRGARTATVSSPPGPRDDPPASTRAHPPA